METHRASQSEDNTQTTLSSIEVPLPERKGDEGKAQCRPSMSPSPPCTPRALLSPWQAHNGAIPSHHSSNEKASYGSEKRDYDEYWRLVGSDGDSQSSEVSERALEVRVSAFQAMLGNVKSGQWQRIGLLSTDDSHTMEEEELGLSVGYLRNNECRD